MSPAPSAESVPQESLATKDCFSLAAKCHRVPPLSAAGVALVGFDSMTGCDFSGGAKLSEAIPATLQLCRRMKRRRGSTIDRVMYVTDADSTKMDAFRRVRYGLAQRLAEPGNPQGSGRVGMGDFVEGFRYEGVAPVGKLAMEDRDGCLLNV